MAFASPKVRFHKFGILFLSNSFCELESNGFPSVLLKYVTLFFRKNNNSQESKILLVIIWFWVIVDLDFFQYLHPFLLPPLLLPLLSPFLPPRLLLLFHGHRRHLQYRFDPVLFQSRSLENFWFRLDERFYFWLFGFGSVFYSN